MEVIKWSWTNWTRYHCNRYNCSYVTLHICATGQSTLDLLSLLLSLLQQDLLGLIQTKLQGVEFAGVVLHRTNVLPQLPAAFLPAQTGGRTWAGLVNTTATFPVLWVPFWSSGTKDWLQHLQVMRESEDKMRSEYQFNDTGVYFTLLLLKLRYQHNSTGLILPGEWMKDR